MKLLSLWEPWATLMAIGAKRIETRSWGTSYRGWLAIQASKGGLSKTDLRDTVLDPIFYTALGCDVKPQPLNWREAFPFGHIVAVVKLVDCQPTDYYLGVFEKYQILSTHQERHFGNYELGRFAWVTDNLFRLPEPIPFKAMQGLCDVHPEVVAVIREQYQRTKKTAANLEVTT